MRSLIVLAALIPSLASAQFTGNQRNGLIKSLNDAVQTIRDGATPTFVNGTRLNFGATVTAAAVCIRCTIRLTPAQATFLSIPPAVFNEPADYYAVMQVCGLATAQAQTAPAWLDELIQTCSPNPIAATAGWPSVVIASRLDPQAQAVATGWQTACSTGTSCNWTPPLQGGGYGASTAAPKGMTLPAGLWSGTGCRLKPPVEIFGQDSMPAECK